MRTGLNEGIVIREAMEDELRGCCKPMLSSAMRRTEAQRPEEKQVFVGHGVSFSCGIGGECVKTELHCHTNMSDGSMSFTEIAELALASGIGCLAVTNHDTTKGLKEMIRHGAKLGLEVIPGIEISAYDIKRERKVHILGYWIEPNHPALEQLCAPVAEKRHEASYRMVQIIREAGYDITWEQVKRFAAGGTGVYKQHIMHALMECGYTKAIYGELYDKLFRRGGNGKTPGLAHLPLAYADPMDAVRAIRRAGGVPVLAHPGQYGNFELVPELVACGLVGIEVLHPHHGPEEEAKAREAAERFNLVMTGGSDFHGLYGDRPAALGSKDPGAACVRELKRRRDSLSPKS